MAKSFPSKSKVHHELGSRPENPHPCKGRKDGAPTALQIFLRFQASDAKHSQRDALQAKMDAQALSSLKLAPVITKKAEVFAKHLREKISKEPEISAQILRSWIREEEEN